MILWGMGISQHVHGTDNAAYAFVALALMTGQIAVPAPGCIPLRGQNNVQGASDSGLIPMMYPNYQRVDNPEARAAVRQALGRARPGSQARPHRGRDHACGDEKGIRGMYVMGEKPRPCRIRTSITRARRWAALDPFGGADIFLTETAYRADVVLPATAWPEKDGTVTNTDRHGGSSGASH